MTARPRRRAKPIPARPEPRRRAAKQSEHERRRNPRAPRAPAAACPSARRTRARRRGRPRRRRDRPRASRERRPSALRVGGPEALRPRRERARSGRAGRSRPTVAGTVTNAMSRSANASVPLERPAVVRQRLAREERQDRRRERHGETAEDELLQPVRVSRGARRSTSPSLDANRVAITVLIVLMP